MTITARYARSAEMARQFSSKRLAREYAKRRGITSYELDRVSSLRGFPANHGGWMIVDTEHSQPCSLSYVM
jgi:hypothetical protein